VCIGYRYFVKNWPVYATTTTIVSSLFAETYKANNSASSYRLFEIEVCDANVTWVIPKMTSSSLKGKRMQISSDLWNLHQIFFFETKLNGRKLRFHTHFRNDSLVNAFLIVNLKIHHFRFSVRRPLMLIVGYLIRSYFSLQAPSRHRGWYKLMTFCLLFSMTVDIDCSGFKELSLKNNFCISLFAKPLC